MSIFKRKKKIALVLGGGGARGMAHIGVLKVMQANDINVDFVIGVSIGAIIGAIYALGGSIIDLEKEAESFTKRKALKELFDISNLKRSLIKGEKARNYLDRYFEHKNFSDVKIPFYALATDLSCGEEVLLSHGNLSKAVMASFAIPGIFPPVKEDGRYMIDGSVINPTPVNLAIELGADVVIGVDLTMQAETEINDPSLITTLMQSFDIIRTQAVKFNLPENDDKFVLIKPELRGAVDTFKFYDIGNFVRSGEQAAKQELDAINKLIGR